MAIAHSTITDPDIHEPKGIALAGPGRVYVANGAGSGDWTPLPDLDVSVYNTPVGVIVPFGGATAPSLWLLCYGQAISRSTYSDLFARIGTTFGTGDGSTTFNVPDLRGRVAAGYELVNGVNSSRLTAQPGGVDGAIFAATGGSQGVALASTNVPSFTGSTSTDGSHNHSLNNATQVARFGSGSNAYVSGGGSATVTMVVSSSGAHTHSVTINSGGGSTHNNVQPTLISTYIIFAGA